jgi:alkylation response protein AidB-like acyl-CoA dehydrogenase
MEFALSEEQVMIQDSFRGTLNRVAPLDRVREVAESGSKLDPAMWDGLVEMGMPSLIIPEEYGGAGLGLMEAAIVAGELGRSAAPVPFVAGVVMAPLAIDLAGNDSQKSAWLTKLASGELRMSVAISETAGGAREDAGVRVDAGKINGRAIFSLDATDADAFLVADGREGLHIVAADAEGLTDRKLRTIDRTRVVNELRFDGVACNSLANCDAAIVSKVIDAGRIILAADSLGAAEEMLSRAVEYAKERRQFDRVIASFQAVKHMCAEMASELEPCRALVWYAAYAFDNTPDEASLQAALAKSHVDEVGRFVARTATEVHGGMGFTDLMGLHYWFKRIGFNRAVLGGPERVRAEAAVLLGL